MFRMTFRKKFFFIEIDSISIIQYSDNIPNLSVLSLSQLNCSIWCYISLLIKTEGTRNKVYLPIRFGYQYYYVEAKNKTKGTMSEVGRYSVSPKSEKFTLQQYRTQFHRQTIIQTYQQY